MIMLEKGPVFHCLLCAVIFLCLLVMKAPSEIAQSDFRRLWSTNTSRDPVGTTCPRCIPCEMDGAKCPMKESGNGNCFACDYSLGRLEGSAITGFNTTKLVAPGKTNSFVYRIVPPQEYSRGTGWPSNIIVKVSCLPYFKRAYIQRQFSSDVWEILGWLWSGEVLSNWLNFACNKQESYNDFNLEHAALNLAKKCQTDHLIPEIRIGEVRGTMPETGYKFAASNGLFMTKAKGLTLGAIAKGLINDDVTKEFFTQKINSSQIVEAAIFDMLIRQRDRHAENIFFSENGNLMLIDNGGISSNKVRSVLLPTTSYHAKLILGNDFMKIRDVSFWNKNPDPGARLDYRCHSNGPIGKNYPPGLKTCMEYVREASMETLSQDLGLKIGWRLRVLKQSAKMLLENGFEWTLMKTAGGRLQLQDPCCEMVPVMGTSNESTSWSCGGDWEFNSTFIRPTYFSMSKLEEVNS